MPSVFITTPGAAEICPPRSPLPLPKSPSRALLDRNTDRYEVARLKEGVPTSVLLHPAVSGTICPGDLTDGTSPGTLEGDAITINLQGTGDNIADVTDGAGNTGVGIAMADIQAGNVGIP